MRITFRSAELRCLRHGSHSLGVTGLDLEIVGGVKGQLLNLVCQPVSNHRLDDPIMNLCVYISTVVNDVT